MILKQKFRSDWIQEHDLELPCKIGRAPGNDFQLINPTISKDHCEIFELEGKILIRDLTSTNGTFVNSKRIHEVTELKSGDSLQLAYSEFQVVLNPPEKCYENNNRNTTLSFSN